MNDVPPIPTTGPLADEAIDRATLDALVARFWDPVKQKYVLGDGAETSDRRVVEAIIEAGVEAFRSHTSR